MYGCFACMCVCAPRYYTSPKNQKRVLHPLRLVLHMIVSCHVGAGNQAYFLCKNSQCS